MDTLVPEDLAAGDGQTLSVVAYGALLDMILRGTIAAGEPVTERLIAARLGMSRTPVREAVRRLEGEGKRLAERTRESARMFEQASAYLPLGVASSFQAMDPYPLYLARGAGSRLMYLAAPACLVAGVALFEPVRRLFENRLGDFLGWISFPLYLVQAAVIYSFSVRGLDVLASFGFDPSAQRWIVGVATVPVAIFFAILFCPVNDFAVVVSRRFGSALFGHGHQAGRYFGAKSRPA